MLCTFMGFVCWWLVVFLVPVLHNQHFTLHCLCFQLQVSACPGSHCFHDKDQKYESNLFLQYVTASIASLLFLADFTVEKKTKLIDRVILRGQTCWSLLHTMNILFKAEERLDCSYFKRDILWLPV